MKDKEPQLPAGRETQATKGADPVPEWLGDKLKEMFSTVMTEPVPDDLMTLLQELERKEKDHGKR